MARGTLYQAYNGVIDGNVCTGVIPSLINATSIQMPTVGTAELIGLRQLAFQTVGTWYVYSGTVSVNGVVGTYNTDCCSCDAISHSTTGGFSECGLTWCGEENQWRYVDFSGTSIGMLGIPQNSTAVVTFSSPISIAPNVNGDPVLSLSYELLPPSPSLTPSGTGSATATATATASASVSPSASVSASTTPVASILSAPAVVDLTSVTPTVVAPVVEAPVVTAVAEAPAVHIAVNAEDVKAIQEFLAEKAEKAETSAKPHV